MSLRRKLNGHEFVHEDLHEQSVSLRRKLKAQSFVHKLLQVQESSSNSKLNAHSNSQASFTQVHEASSK